MLLGQCIHLLRLETSVSEHADLAGDVAPVVLATELLEVLLEESTHGDNAVSHALNLAQPLLVELGVVQDGGSNTGTVDRRVGVERADQDLDLRVDTLLLFGVGADNGEGANTLTVETLGNVSMRKSLYSFKTTDHVLGETLAEGNLVTLLDEVADGEGILVSVSTGEALVGHVEEGVVTILLDDIAQRAPLLLGRVDTGGVVSAGMEKDNAALGHLLDVLDHTLEVETDGVLVVVAVLLNLEA